MPGGCCDGQEFWGWQLAKGNRVIPAGLVPVGRGFDNYQARIIPQAPLDFHRWGKGRCRPA